MRNKKTLILSLIALIWLILITAGVTYAFFNYAKEGTTENTVTTGTITFLYTEVDQVGAGISIEDALPTTDEVGKVQTGTGKEFNFKVTSSLSGDIDIPYTVTARKKDTSSLDESVVRLYLTEVSGSVEKELLLDNYNNLEDYENVPEGKTEKVIYTGLVPTGSTNYEKEFKLRMWIDNSIDFSPTKDENGQDVYPYNNKEFTVKVNVYANAKVVTDSEIDMANTTTIDTISVNEGIVEISNSEEYDYKMDVANEITEASIEVETTNPEATVEVTKIEETTAYNTNTTIKRLSTTRSITLTLEEGDNLFNIKVVSANKQVEKEYILNIYRSLSCAYQPGDIVGTFDYTGNSEEFTVPCSGTYKLEVYGASGQSKNNSGSYGYGGKGGYSYGNKQLSKDDNLYIVVGATGTDSVGGYNGGGTGDTYYAGAGGGATHIATGDTNRGELTNYANYKSEILIVAGGGGGGFSNSSYGTYNGGTGGGITGGNASGAYSGGTIGTGGTQTTGSAFGKGFNGNQGASAGGGGYYGGLGTYYTAGGGGSGYIDGVTDGVTENGVHEGNGKAQITLISLD